MHSRRGARCRAPGSGPRHCHHVRPTSWATAAAKKDMAANLVESVAGLALRTRLKRYDDVIFNVDCSMGGLLSGKVQSVEMIGKGWESPQGLTAWLLQMNLGQVAIDPGALLSERRIKLAHMPSGTARVLFTAQDFSSFLNHPLMVKAAARAIQGQPFLFDKDSVVLHLGRQVSGSTSRAVAQNTPAARLSGRSTQSVAVMEPAAAAAAAAGAGWPTRPSVMFTGRWAGRAYQVCLQAGSDRVQPSSAAPLNGTNSQVRATAVQQALGGGELHSRQHGQHVESASWAERLKGLHGWDGLTQDELAASQGLTHLFQNLMIDLQGAELRFSSLHLMSAAEARSVGQTQVLIDLRLGLRIRDFPPLNLQF